MAMSDGRCFVYVRYWPGFTDSFPYEQFSTLPENEIERALRASLAKELWWRHDEIRARRAALKKKRLESISRLKRQAVAPVNFDRRSTRRVEAKPRKTRCQRFARMASYIGWHEVGGYIARNDGEYLFTPKVWIAELVSVECATYLVKELTELQPADDNERERIQVFNPKYGWSRCDSLNRGEQASILAAIQQLWSKEPMYWADVVRPLLPRIARLLNAWQSVESSTEADSVETEAPLADERHGFVTSVESAQSGDVAAGVSVAQRDDTRDERLSKLKPAERKAFFTYEIAAFSLESKVGDREAHDWLRENGLPDDKGNMGELADYELPAFDTWSRQLRAARKVLGEQKNSRRAGRPTSRSIVAVDEI
jgi:hypothetical protein